MSPVDPKGVVMLFFIITVLPGSLDKHMLIHKRVVDSAFPEAPADLLWISTRAALTLRASMVF